MNASNEVASSNLAQHNDWLQGELSHPAGQPDRLARAFRCFRGPGRGCWSGSLLWQTLSVLRGAVLGSSLNT